MGESDEISKLKKQIMELQKEHNEKDFTANKKMLDIRKEMGSQIIELKVKHENELKTLNSELNELRQSNLNLQEKSNSIDIKMKLVNSKFESLQTEKRLLEEEAKIKEDLVSKCKLGMDQETQKIQKEKKEREDIENQLNIAKVNRAQLEEDADTLIDILTEFSEINKKKKLSLKDHYGKIGSEKYKTSIFDIVSQSGIKSDLSN